MKTQLLLFAIAFTAMTSCTKDAAENTSISESSLSTLALSEETILQRSLFTGNETWNIKTNDVASNAYSKGKKNFPLHAMLVKEKHDASGAITGFDIMYKVPGDSNAEDGWLYEEVDSEGKVINGVSAKGVACKSCHVAGSRINLH
jgi:Cytochrome P460